VAFTAGNSNKKEARGGARGTKNIHGKEESGLREKRKKTRPESTRGSRFRRKEGKKKKWAEPSTNAGSRIQGEALLARSDMMPVEGGKN